MKEKKLNTLYLLENVSLVSKYLIFKLNFNHFILLIYVFFDV